MKKHEENASIRTTRGTLKEPQWIDNTENYNWAQRITLMWEKVFFWE